MNVSLAAGTEGKTEKLKEKKSDRQCQVKTRAADHYTLNVVWL